jgi:hypothetical protein
MHAGKRPCGPFRCDDATEMQAGGLDALEHTAGPDCPRLARQILSERPVDGDRKDAARSPQLANTCIRQHIQLCYILDTNHAKSDSSRVRYDPATGDPEAGYLTCACRLSTQRNRLCFFARPNAALVKLAIACRIRYKSILP